MSLSATCPNNSIRLRGIRCYTSAVKAIRERLRDGKFDGSEDWLLATVIALYIFEVNSFGASRRTLRIEVMRRTGEAMGSPDLRDSMSRL